MPQKQVVKPPAVAGIEEVDDETVAVSGLENAKVAEGMNTFLLDLQRERSYVGTSAFLIFALRYRLRVCVWYDALTEDLLSVYAPWATDAINETALFQGVCCKYVYGGNLELLGEDPRRTNHWVAAFPSGSGSLPSGDQSLGEGEDETTQTFRATYLSFGLHIVRTIVDGDCGLDTMCLMLGWNRCKQNRDRLRSELAAFALKHIGNRAFIAMLHSVGELSSHLGLELESAGAEMLADSGAAELVVGAAKESHHGDGAELVVGAAIGAELVVGAAKESHHGDGAELVVGAAIGAELVVGAAKESHHGDGAELVVGAAIGAELVVGAAKESHHGDGGGPPVDAATAEAKQQNFSDVDILAVMWKCRLQKSSLEFAHDLLRRLPAVCIERMREEYQNRATVKAEEDTADKMTFLLRRDELLTTQVEAAQSFLRWCEDIYGPFPPKECQRLKCGKLPYGKFAEYIKAHRPLQKACGGFDRVTDRNRKQYVRLRKLYETAVRRARSTDSAVAEVKECALAKPADDDCFAKFKYTKPRVGTQYFAHNFKCKRDGDLHRARGGGRHRVCAVLREMLATWYNIVRHSVNVKIMCRFPKKVLLVQALKLQQDYYCSCLNNQVEPEHVKVDARWLNGFLAEYRLTSRRPNRKFKVPRAVLAQRLKIWWTVTAKLRKLIMLTFGYEPKFRNIDQSPFHGNEAGSAESNTISLKGAPTVPLVENHAATRERWSLNSVTDSSAERISKKLPGFELMFKAEGKVKEGKLQAYVASKGLPFKVSVVTGPSGSYREHDILDFLDKWLEPWGPGREWEFLALDAYAPGLTDNVQRLCWSRGYICITHGGGASMVAQTNDTDHHLHVRKRFIELQTALMVRKARRNGGGMVDLTPEENIDIMIEVMSDLSLHLKASKGYKYTGTTVALDGTEDIKICREAKDFWQELGMRKIIDSAVAEVEDEYKAGRLPWMYKTVQSLITPYPRTGHLDELKVGQDDEATPDPDGVPWEAEKDENEGDEAGKAGDDDGEDEEILDFDPADWTDQRPAIQNNASDADVSRHGDGDAQIVKLSLDAEQADAAVEHSNRLRSLKHAQDIFKDVGGALGASLLDTVGRVMHTETKRFNILMRGDEKVLQEMRAGLEAEEAMYRRGRREFQEHMQQKREKARVEHALKEATAKLHRARKEQREAEAVVTAREEVKAYSLEMLGKGKKKGGLQQHQKARLEVLQRMRRAAELSPEQTSQWEFFKTTWDREMAEAHGEDWAELFAELIQQVLNDLTEGRRNALSVFMHNETKRVLADTPALLVPGKG